MTPHSQPLSTMVARWPSAEARHWAEESIPRLCQEETVLAVVVFGSSVRDVDFSTDLDVLYIYQVTPVSQAPPPLDVDVRAYPAADVDRLLSNAHDLLGWALRLGRVVCERNRYWTKLVEKWAKQLPFPSVDLAMQRARKSERLSAELTSAGDEDAAFEQKVSALTHLARAHLLRQGVFPASRPELPKQLLQVGELELANLLHRVLIERNARAHGISVAPEHPS